MTPQRRQELAFSSLDQTRSEPCYASLSVPVEA